MASIRRTLSPVPRPGTVPNGEACSVASPLSKSSSAQNHHQPAGMLSSSFSSLDHALYRIQSFILGLFSYRPSRPLERPKLKGQVWRRYFFHFITCFVVGVFLGLTPFASMNLSRNLMSKHQAFSFEVIPHLERVQPGDGMRTNANSSVSSLVVNDDTKQVPHVTELELQNWTSDDIFSTQLNLDPNRTFHKLLIIVTPTNAGPFQAYQLNRLAHTLKLVPPPLLWIVVDVASQSAETADILRRSSVMYRHLVCNDNLTEAKDKSVYQRNVALSHIERHRLDGIVYFADDNNIYTIELFEEMRKISRFGTWTVAKTMEKTEAILEGPICNGTQVIGWHTYGRSGRFQRFHAEMPGFAFNSTTLWDPKRWHRPTLEPIRQVDAVDQAVQASIFIEQVVEDESQMECLPQNSSKILVWHLHTESSNSYPPQWLMKNYLDVTVPLT